MPWDTKDVEQGIVDMDWGMDEVERGIFDVEKGIVDVERGIVDVDQARSVLEGAGNIGSTAALGLDAVVLDELMETLEEVSRTEGATILIASHNYEEVERIATYVGLLRDY